MPAYQDRKQQHLVSHLSVPVFVRLAAFAGALEEGVGFLVARVTLRAGVFTEGFLAGAATVATWPVAY